MAQRGGADDLDVSFQEVVHSALTGNAEDARHKRFAEDSAAETFIPSVSPWSGRPRQRQNSGRIWDERLADIAHSFIRLRFEKRQSV